MNDVVQHVSSTTSPVTLTNAATNHLLTYLNKEKQYHGVRISVKKTGCSGLSYVVDYVTDFKEQDVVVPLNPDYNLYIDKASYPFLKGMKIDYVTQGLNSRFMFNNPNQTGQYGCGESFTVDTFDE